VFQVTFAEDRTESVPWLGSFLIPGQIEFESGATIDFARHGDSAPMQIENPLDDRKAQSGRSGLTSLIGLAMVESVEDLVEIRLCNTAASVADGDGNAFGALVDINPDMAARLREMDGVSQEILEHTLDEADVSIHNGRILGSYRLYGDFLARRIQLEFLRGILQQLGQRETLERGRHACGIQLGELKQIVDKSAQSLCIFARNAQAPLAGIIG